MRMKKARNTIVKYNYRLILQYDGTKYNGWQKQGNTDCTIQGILEEKLGQWLGEGIDLKGSGRTDRGVHASGQVANFYSKRKVAPEEMKEYLNSVLANDLHVDQVDCVSLDFHSRKSATGKTYEYAIWNSSEKNVFYPNYLYTVEQELDLDNMKQAAKYLIGTHDFLGFSSLKDNKKSTVRTISDISILKNGAQIIMQFTGDGFLYHMIRILSGTLIEVGLGNKKPDIILDILEQQDRQLAGPTIPAHGLKLLHVYYENTR